MNITSIIRRVLIIVAIILVWIRPTYSTEEIEKSSNNLNIWFVVDATGSMVAKDVDGGSTRRFEKVKQDITDIVKNVPGAKYGMIVQDYYTHNVSPLSYSADAIISAETNVSPVSSLYAGASNLSELLEFTANRIDNQSQRNPERANIAIIMSDGEDISDSQLTIPQSLSSRTIVLGYGSTEGSLIEKVNDPSRIASDGLLSEEYLTYYGHDSRVTIDSDWRVISKINEDNLRTIATRTSGKYYHRDSGNVPADVYNTLKTAATEIKEENKQSVAGRGELYFIFAFCLLVLLLWECEETVLSLASEKEKHHA